MCDSAGWHPALFATARNELKINLTWLKISAGNQGWARQWSSMIHSALSHTVRDFIPHCCIQRRISFCSVAHSAGCHSALWQTANSTGWIKTNQHLQLLLRTLEPKFVEKWIWDAIFMYTQNEKNLFIVWYLTLKIKNIQGCVRQRGMTSCAVCDSVEWVKN